jgi:hypothetical protein
MNWLKTQLAKVIIRHAVNAAGAWLVTQGILSGSQLSQAIGAIGVLVAIGHSLWEKREAIAADFQKLKTGTVPVILLLLALGASASAQTNSAASPGSATNSGAALAPATNAPLSWGLVGKAIWNGLKTASNYSVSPYATYAENAPKGRQFGGGALFVFDVSQNVGIGMGVDYLGSFNMVNGNVTIKQSLRPLTYLGMTSAFASNFTVTPFGIAGACSPISSAGSANGSIGAIYGAGFNLDLCQFDVGGTTLKLSTGYARTEWSNLGAYSGWRDSLFLGLRAGF